MRSGAPAVFVERLGAGEPPRPTSRICRQCGVKRPADMFQISNFFERGRRIVCVYSARCTHCERAIDDAGIPKKELRALLTRARCGSRSRNKVFGLVGQDLVLLWQKQGGKCALSGRPMQWGGGPYAPSVDRIDSRFGYTADNVWLVCWAVNAMKQAMTVEEFGDWCKAIVLHALGDE